MNERELITNHKKDSEKSPNKCLNWTITILCLYLHHKCNCTNGHKNKMTKSNAITTEQIYKLKNPGDSWPLTGHHRWFTWSAKKVRSKTKAQKLIRLNIQQNLRIKAYEGTKFDSRLGVKSNPWNGRNLKAGGDGCALFHGVLRTYHGRDETTLNAHSISDCMILSNSICTSPSSVQTTSVGNVCY